jgi:hypothetical protein
MTCKQAAEMLSRSADIQLSFWQRLGLTIHTLICGMCRRFRRQLTGLHAACDKALREDTERRGDGLSAEARARIAAALDSLKDAD